MDKIIKEIKSHYFLISILFVLMLSCSREQPQLKSKSQDVEVKLITPQDEFIKKLSRLPEVDKFLSPYAEAVGRGSYKFFYKRCISTFGSHRDSYVRGHKHSGADLRGALSEPVYPIASGVVTDIHLAFPHRTIIVLHHLPDNGYIYSVYKHVEGIVVSIGDTVSPDRPIARLFDKAELKRSQFGVCHLHFEIKHDVSDGGRASFTCFTQAELDKYYYDPLTYMKKWMEK